LLDFYQYMNKFKTLLWLCPVVLSLGACSTQTYISNSSGVLPQMQVTSPNDLVSGSYSKVYFLGLGADSSKALEMALLTPA